jgi:(p)ppGpp synthase/HD superfamily hydrolase
MMRQSNGCRQPEHRRALLNRAYVYAMQAHGTQKRASGDPYFAHPLEVAAILTDLKLDDATVAAAVLHDTIEDTDRRRGSRSTSCSVPISAPRRRPDQDEEARPRDSKKAKQAENLRKLLLAIADDVRVLLVKLADRLHNMRTLHHVPPETSACASPRRPSTSMRRSPAAWACRKCARSSRTCRSAILNPEAYRDRDRAPGRS